MDDDEKLRFNRWKSGSDELTLFLDAVDESKIRCDDDFFKALDRVKKGIYKALSRTKFVISSRVSEWRSSADGNGVVERLGLKQADSRSSNNDTVRSQSSTTEDIEKGEDNPSIMVVTLLPLNPTQVETYAKHHNISNSEEFITALNDNNAWTYAGRPLDVEHLYDYWDDKGSLGNLTALTEHMIGKLLSEVPNKKTLDTLSEEKARKGAEALAAAVTLSRRFKISVMDDERVPSTNFINPITVLPESWLPKEHRAMMNRPIFDAASRGAISFHHRHHIEYLSAAWIENLMANNCGLDALDEMLFAKVAGQRVLRPVLKPIAAWLITSGDEPWRHRLGELILEACPEIHLAYGDPSVLSLEYRRKVLSRLIQRYKGRNRVMLDWDHTALARFANEGLVNDLNDYLLDSSIAEDIRADLLMVVREGKLLGCVSSALSVFSNESSSDDLKQYTVAVISGLGSTSHRHQLYDLLDTQKNISNRLLGGICTALFPKVITVEGLIGLLRSSQSVNQFGIDLPYDIGKLTKKDLDDQAVVELLCGFLSLLGDSPYVSGTQINQKFSWVVSLLPICINRFLKPSSMSKQACDSVIEAIFLLEQADLYGVSRRGACDEDEWQPMLDSLAECDVIRRELFWARTARYREKSQDEPSLYEFSQYGSFIKYGSSDCKWLLIDAKESAVISDRLLALEISSQLFQIENTPFFTSGLQLRHAAKGTPELIPIWRQHILSGLRSPFFWVWFKYFRQKLLRKWWWNSKLRHIKPIPQKIRDRWWLWRHLKDLRKGLYPSTLSYFSRLASTSGSQYSGCDWSKVTSEWGQQISSSVEIGCTTSWREFEPPFPHEKIEKNTTDHRVIIGLGGLQTLWQQQALDFNGFTEREVELAIRYACNELNGFPEWFWELVNAKPDVSADILRSSISAEWEYSKEVEYVNGVISKLARKQGYSEAIEQAFWLKLQEIDPKYPQILNETLSFLSCSNSIQRHAVICLASKRVRDYSFENPQWFTWLSLWLKLDALPALNYLEAILPSESVAATDVMVDFCSAIHERHDLQVKINPVSYLEPTALARFIPLLYLHIRVEEDRDRANNGSYTPDARDDAERFRSTLLEALNRSADFSAERVMQDLCGNPDMASQHDWLLHLLDQRKNQQCDATPWDVSDIRVFSEKYCSEPRSDYQLFRLIHRLLKEIKNHIETPENASNRKQVRESDLEEDFRGFLYRELPNRSNDWFTVTQESEVDLKQQPDLRIERVRLNPLPIEVKLTNLKHWTLPKLLERLENQLIGQYIRPENIRYGIYILGNTSPKRRWENPETGERLNFKELVVLIQKRAATLQFEMRHGVDGIEVVGIDFSDPRERK